MHLVSALAAGVNGAANGSAILVSRGTATPATYYADFEASQLVTGTVTLDANGSAIVYVNELVDVKVFDVNGFQLREFVAGAEAPAVEVISHSFTGTSYSDGSIGTSKPTTLQTVLDAWLTSAGSPDFRVTVGGVSTALTAAVAGLAGLFFNVKTYGAIGDGVADDGAAITAAIAAAAATGNVGATVFFPAGSYRTTTTLAVTAGVCLLGTGGTSVRILVDNTSGLLTSGVSFTGADSGSRTVQGIWFGLTGAASAVPLLSVGGGGAATCVDFVNCITGNDNFTKGIHFLLGGTGQASRVTITRCSSYQGGNSNIVNQTSSGRVVIRDSDMVVTLAGAYSSTVVNLIDGVGAHDCRFDATAVTSGTFSYIGFAPNNGWGGCVFTGNRFRNNVAATITALFNSLAAPIYDCVEYGNFFGDTSGSVTAYGYTTDGYAALNSMSGTTRAHGSRVGRCAEYISNIAFQIDAKQFETVSILRMGAGAQSISATKGSLGDKLVVAILNESGGVLNIAFGADFSLRAGTTSVTTNNAARSYVTFEWLSINPNGTAGQWVQTATESLNNV